MTYWFIFVMYIFKYDSESGSWLLFVFFFRFACAGIHEVSLSYIDLNLKS